MAANTNENDCGFASSIANVGTTARSVAVTLHKGWQTVTSWVDLFRSYEDLKIKLSKILNNIQSSKYAGKQVKLSPGACNKIQQSCSKMARYSKDWFNFNLESEVTEALGDGIKFIDKEKLEKLLSKLNSNMTKQLERMLWGELLKTSSQTLQMCETLFDTCRIIRDSKQYRESSTLKSATSRIEEYLKNGEKFYKTAKDEINRIESEPNTHPKKYILERIALNLDRARLENNWAKRELDDILRNISQHLEKMTSNRTDHGVHIGLSLLNAAVTGMQFAWTPSFLLSKTTKALFAANEGLQAVSVIGHSIGFYWSYDEIHKLEETQHEMKTLEATMEDSFKMIDFAIEKLEMIKERIIIVPDSEDSDVVQE